MLVKFCMTRTAVDENNNNRRHEDAMYFIANRDFSNSCLAGSFWGRTKGDLYFLYLISFDSEEFHVPGAAAILGFAVVEDEGFVALFKQLLNAIGRRFLAIGPAPFEISFTVNAVVERTGKYEVVAQ